MSVRPIHVVEAEIVAMLDRLLANNRHMLNDTGSTGAQARMQAAVSRAWFLAVAAEMNRGTDIEDMLHAVPCVLANWLGSFVASLGVEDPRHQAVVLNATVRNFHHAIVQTLNDPTRNSGSVGITRGSSA